MPEEKKESHAKTTMEFAIGIFLLFTVLTFVSQSLHAKLRSAEPGTFLYEVNGLIGGKQNAREAVFGIGSLIQTKVSSVLYDTPGGRILKNITAGARGVIIDGPLDYLGDTWWRIQFEDGAVGWLKENDLLLEGDGVVGEKTGPLHTIYSSFQFVSTIISLLLLTGIAYSFIRLYQIRRAEVLRLRGSGVFGGGSMVSSEKTKEKEGTAKWAVVQRHAQSQSESDWRLAVLEADILLDELVRSRGWQGDNLGERLKGIDRADFQTLDKAWEAHKVRNTIAHEGTNYVLTEREAKRIISLFEEVFNEFNYI